jgi:hypothetical protein
MDNLDHLLYHLPSDPPDSELAQRIFQRIRKRKRQHCLIRLSASSLLAAGGTWLLASILMPLFNGVTLPQNGLGYLNDIYYLLQSDWTTSLFTGLQSLSDKQFQFTSSINVAGWVILIILAPCAMLASGQLLRDREAV